jgi:hypothetical protein
MKKGVGFGVGTGSGAGSGSISQRYESGHQNVTDSQHWVLGTELSLSFM